MYGTKSKYRRFHARKGRVAKMAKGKSTKIQTLAKAVSRIQRGMRTKSQYLNYSQNDNINPTGDYNSMCLSKCSSWASVFGTSSDDNTANKVIHKSFGMDMYFTLENTSNEPDTTRFTVFLVSLKDAIGSSFTPSSGSLSLSANVHYVASGGLFLLNKKVFNIHKTKRFVLTNHGTSLANPSAQTQYGTDYRFYWKIRVNKALENPYGNWKDLQSGQDPSKTYYLLIFNDNSSLDLQNPNVQITTVHTVQTVA